MNKESFLKNTSQGNANFIPFLITAPMGVGATEFINQKFVAPVTDTPITVNLVTVEPADLNIQHPIMGPESTLFEPVLEKNIGNNDAVLIFDNFHLASFLAVSALERVLRAFVMGVYESDIPKIGNNVRIVIVANTTEHTPHPFGNFESPLLNRLVVFNYDPSQNNEA